MKKLFLLIALLSPSASFAATASVGSCEYLDSIGNLVSPLKHYANGQIRVAHVDTEEPACCSSHMLIYIPSPEMGFQCFAISSSEDGLGFSGLSFNKLKATYNPEKGLLLNFPVGVYDHETGTSKPAGNVKVRISLAGEGSVKIEK